MCFKAKTGVATTTVSSTPIDPAPLMNTVNDQGVIFGDGSETSNDTGTKSLTNNLDSTNASTSSDAAPTQLKNTSTSTSDVSNSTSTKKKTSAITSTNSL